MDHPWALVQEGLFNYPLGEGQEPSLLANRCTHCGRTFFPKRSLCPTCFDEGNLEDVVLPGRGVIYASTVVHIPSPIGIKAPYAYGYVDLTENQVRILALFTGNDPSSFAIGQEVELVLEPIREDQKGQNIIGYKFRPVSS